MARLPNFEVGSRIKSGFYNAADSLRWAATLAAIAGIGNALVHHDWLYNTASGWHFSSDRFYDESVGFVVENATTSNVLAFLIGGIALEGFTQNTHGKHGGH